MRRWVGVNDRRGARDRSDRWRDDGDQARNGSWRDLLYSLRRRRDSDCRCDSHFGYGLRLLRWLDWSDEHVCRCWSLDDRDAVVRANDLDTVVSLVWSVFDSRRQTTSLDGLLFLLLVLLLRRSTGLCAPLDNRDVRSAVRVDSCGGDNPRLGELLSAGLCGCDDCFGDSLLVDRAVFKHGSLVVLSSCMTMLVVFGTRKGS